MASSSQSHRLFTLPFVWFAGSLLIIAGLLKLIAPPHQLNFVQYPAEVFSAIWVCEIMLGLWLVSGVNRVQALLFGILAFLALAIVSGRMAMLGIRDCGCLGILPTNPWIMCGLDVVSAVGLSVALHYSTDRPMFRQGLRRFLASSTTIAVILSAIAIFVVGSYGSLEAAVRNWQGHSLEAPRSVDAALHRGRTFSGLDFRSECWRRSDQDYRDGCLLRRTCGESFPNHAATW